MIKIEFIGSRSTPNDLYFKVTKYYLCSKKNCGFKTTNKSDFRFSFFGLAGAVCPKCHAHHFLIDPD